MLSRVASGGPEQLRVPDLDGQPAAAGVIASAYAWKANCQSFQPKSDFRLGGVALPPIEVLA